MRKIGFKIISMTTFLSLFFLTAHETSANLNSIANEYVKLALEIHSYKEDDGIVDSYIGPQENLPQKQNLEREFPFDILRDRGENLSAQLEAIDVKQFSNENILRLEMLKKNVNSLRTKLNMLNGVNLSFDEEAFNLYDVIPPNYSETHFKELINELDKIIPGKGDLYSRYQEYVKQFIIPKDKLEIVFRTAIKEARDRTLNHIILPQNENFELQFVTGKSWSAYNYYQGNGKSIIQINTDLPIHMSIGVWNKQKFLRNKIGS